MSEAVSGGRLYDVDLLHGGRPNIHRSIGFTHLLVRGQSSSAVDLRRRRQEIRLGKRHVDSVVVDSSASCGYGFPRNDATPVAFIPSSSSVLSGIASL
ncbi:hypothetical protein ZWY2020_055605 [Hordeum vulgare]|nr:hypothetical protein ZWY2020_055605 [Hordeum vulgare]